MEKIDIENIKKQAKEFKAKEFQMNEYPLLKKIDIENTVFTVYEYKRIMAGEKEYYNFRAINEDDEIFCFNGSSILRTQLEEFGMPCKVKLVKKSRPNDKLRPYYWVFDGLN